MLKRLLSVSCSYCRPFVCILSHCFINAVFLSVIVLSFLTIIYIYIYLAHKQINYDLQIVYFYKSKMWENHGWKEECVPGNPPGLFGAL